MRIALSFACTENWDAMDGDEQERQCALCVCKVYDISAMGRKRASALLAPSSPDGEVCVRFETGSDGTVRFAAATMAALTLSLAAPALADGTLPTLNAVDVVSASFEEASDLQGLEDGEDPDCVEGAMDTTLASSELDGTQVKPVQMKMGKIRHVNYPPPAPMAPPPVTVTSPPAPVVTPAE